MATFNFGENFELFDDVLFGGDDDTSFDMMLDSKLDMPYSDSTDYSESEADAPGSPQNVMDGPSSPVVTLELGSKAPPKLKLSGKPATKTTIGRKRKLSGEKEEVKKQRLQARRLRKNSREKQRRQEVNILFEALVNLLGLPAESKSDKVTILATGINTIKTLRAHSSDDGLKKAEELVTSLTRENAISTACPDKLSDAVPMALPLESMSWF